MPTHAALQLHCFGNSNVHLTIQADGNTENNGHFSYVSKKLPTIFNYALYFNKGLRTYIVSK